MRAFIQIKKYQQIDRLKYGQKNPVLVMDQSVVPVDLEYFSRVSSMRYSVLSGARSRSAHVRVHVHRAPTASANSPSVILEVHLKVRNYSPDTSTVKKSQYLSMLSNIDLPHLFVDQLSQYLVVSVVLDGLFDTLYLGERLSLLKLSKHVFTFLEEYLLSHAQVVRTQT